MNLKELLGEALYKQVIEKAGDKKIAIVSDGNWIPKEKFNELNENTKELKKQLKDRDIQLAELGEKAKGHEELTAKINELTEENKKAAAEYQQKLDQQAFDFALKSALTSVKAKNPKAVEALLNKESIKLDGDKLLGLEDQLKALQKSDGYLFEAEQQHSKPTFSQGQHQTTPGGEPSTLLDALNHRFSTTNN
ncbi:phage scaffolding protein [Cytobacillus oceanisediminis]|uniref:Scaffolding protein n=1 Tax=Cytobacillus oceanisediminis TaxID=665099 RepID=A0ABX3CJ35_9BACI|nr:phage scaffolding protein [Cytobacillus oceanisediminis]OHX38836.1 scaffolding protein [Cytobacillus oceanisediminis]